MVRARVLAVVVAVSVFGGIAFYTTHQTSSVMLRIYAVLNALLPVSVCVFLWVLAARANNHGWYVAQRVGFHFAAIDATMSVTPFDDDGRAAQGPAGEFMCI